MLEFYNDFFFTNIMNHCEFLKTLPEIGKDDIDLLKSIVGFISTGTHKTDINAFYDPLPGVNDYTHQIHTDLPKNIVCILETYVLVKNLKAHEFNIFEFAFLAGNGTFHETTPQDKAIKIISFFTLLFQYVILIILIFYNVPTKVNLNILVIIITIGTSFFFTKLAYNQYSHSTKFNNCYKLTGDVNKQIYLHMNFLSNVILPILVPFFNFYYILLSEDPNNAILNSLALFFILELDSMILPSWTESRINDECVTNIHDFIMDGDDDTNNINPLIEKITECSEDIHNLQEKTYFSIDFKNKKINFHVKKTPQTYLTIQYKVSGKNTYRFLNLISQFDSINTFRDIHD